MTFVAGTHKTMGDYCMEDDGLERAFCTAYRARSRNG
ncbi:MAG: hypothetical protein ACI90M_001945, partial [Candidatus Azotimanducaceae bacterium]